MKPIEEGSLRPIAEIVRTIPTKGKQLSFVFEDRAILPFVAFWSPQKEQCPTPITNSDLGDITEWRWDTLQIERGSSGFFRVFSPRKEGNLISRPLS